MPEQHGPYHRTGEVTRQGCAVSALPLTEPDQNGRHFSAQLLDAGHASELELLRTIASGLGVRWGHDDLGWRAMVASG
jgi:hypothetical protein